jgi:hypothetical protein
MKTILPDLDSSYKTNGVQFPSKPLRRKYPQGWRGSVNFRYGRGMPVRVSDWSPV